MLLCLLHPTKKRRKLGSSFFQHETVLLEMHFHFLNVMESFQASIFLSIQEDHHLLPCDSRPVNPDAFVY